MNWERLCDLINGSKEVTHAQYKQQQCRKLENLKNEQEQKEKARNQVDLSGTQLKKWVINLSKYSLSKDEENVLGKGLGFSPTPTKIPSEEIIVQTELVAFSLPPQDRDKLRFEVTRTLSNSSPPKPNLTKSERQALDHLKKNEEIMILPADKGKAAVIMDKED